MSTDPDSPLTPSRLPDVGKVSQFAETKHREIHVRMRARKLSLTKNSAQVPYVTKCPTVGGCMGCIQLASLDIRSWVSGC